MEKQSYKHEYRLMLVAIVCAGLLVFGHLILAKSFASYAWTEYTAAAIPFVMFGLCLFAIRYAAKEQPE
ncbi:asparaginyl-tRNA synthetase [Vibrio galatheae]|uniref:Asparaginyl-tRNA synthetase n=1 Tax=Vibrio galatheae TaxID=579748 RepID=A0A0F4NPR7_9VIBR|nr:hypothetical protein [Vibrio galatheae]KJY84889.1 asparaginyl-tRNA synthetase [Vibrio galatheae]